jgi:hypothetical protein
MSSLFAALPPPWLEALLPGGGAALALLLLLALQ